MWKDKGQKQWSCGYLGMWSNAHDQRLFKWPAAPPNFAVLQQWLRRRPYNHRTATQAGGLYILQTLQFCNVSHYSRSLGDTPAYSRYWYLYSVIIVIWLASTLLYLNLHMEHKSETEIDSFFFFFKIIFYCRLWSKLIYSWGVHHCYLHPSIHLSPLCPLLSCSQPPLPHLWGR